MSAAPDPFARLVREVHLDRANPENIDRYLWMLEQPGVVRRLGAPERELVVVRRIGDSPAHVAEAPPVLSPLVFAGAPPLAGNGHLVDVVALCGRLLKAPVIVRGDTYDCRVCRRILDNGMSA